MYTASGAMSVQSPEAEGLEVGLGVPAAYGEGLGTGPAGLGKGVAAGVAVGVTPGGVAAGVLRTPVSWTTGDLGGLWGLGDGEAVPGEVTDGEGEVTDGDASSGEVTEGEATPGELVATGLTPGEGNAGEGEDGVGVGLGEVPGGQRLQVAAQ